MNPLKVKPRTGDSIWYYSRLFGVRMELLKQANNELDEKNLTQDSEVGIAGFVREAYEVKKGDTAFSIARSLHIGLDALYLVNHKKDLTMLYTGDTIDIPRRLTSRIVDPSRKYDSSVFKEDLDCLKVVYPFLECSTIGQSVMGKQIHHLKIGKGKKKIHWNGSFHANEWITSSVIMTFLNDYLLALTNNMPMRGVPVYPLFEQVTLSIVPMVNPDGVDLVLSGPTKDDFYNKEVEVINRDHPDFTGWKANIRGVDLNNQFPAKWEIEKERKEPKAPAPRDYPGDNPLTEPEVIAMAELAKRENFDMVVAFHTQGEEFYWGYEGFEPDEAERMAVEFERVSTYKSVRYVDSHAGFKDWFIQEFKKPGFTLELGKGINPLPLSQFGNIYQKVYGICLASLYI
ncbi:g-D-glutamyl-meso-diaminopimelate peptidase [Bacillus tianshenii]|uniref:G-D-glutamyl-meso-diaminopimelate peptidase n=2 Tax=Sutcliffiella tianshenii TaxID=1463404 RepID=A0ABS2NZX1_9BACI|nr:g-D-glutamyl-meso-diaminopimelate peptidase [Bacillus tianshenii]